MVRKICVDSDILIGFLKSAPEARLAVEKSGEGIFCTTSVNVFEVWIGRKKDELVSETLSSLQIAPLDDKSAKMAADIARSLQNDGNMIDLNDLFIGAICISEGMEILTFNTRHFERLKKFGLVLTDTNGKRSSDGPGYV